MDISVVVPLFNEEESLPELHAWICRVMQANNFSYEIIFVNDGSTDHSWDVIEELSKKDSNVKAIKFRRNYGKSPALYCGFKKHRATWSSPWTPTCRTRPTRYRLCTT